MSLDQELIAPLAGALLAMGDDELILGHRDSEWCGHAPILEEDIAFANIALDEIGHAALWYSLLAELTGNDPDAHPDQLVFFRDLPDFRSVQMVELPNGDWAFSMLRHFLFDAAETVRLESLASGPFEPLAGLAARVRKEEVYHYRHTSAWIARLGQGTEESHRRSQTALDELWPYAQQMFTPEEGEELLVEAGLVSSSAEARARWDALVLPLLRESGLKIPTDAKTAPVGREAHSPYLKPLVSEMQSLARSDPEAEW